MVKTKRAMTYLYMILVSIISIFPFLWIVISATNPSVEVTKGTLVPGKYLIKNIEMLMDTVDLWPAFANSLYISAMTTLLSLFIASLAGYGFEIYRSRAKDVVFSMLLLSMMIPFAALMVPLYRMFAKISSISPLIGIDTLSAVILPTMTTAFLIFFFRQSTKMFPREMIEAGRIDGLSELGLFLRIYVPTMKTTYAAATIITFMASWNNYLWPLIVLQSPGKMTVPLLISNLGSSYTPDYGVILTAIVIATLPTALLFFLMQKQFVAGMMGSIK